MLPALPVDKISGRGPDMVGAGRDEMSSSDTTRSGHTSAPGPKRAMGSSTVMAVAEQAAGALPVRVGEERWTGVELTEIRARLQAEIYELGTEIATAESQIAEGDSADGAGDDQADIGAKTYEREHEMSLAYNARDLLVQNERALERIAAGTYGVCESCGKAIGKARLQAFPRATLCVTCKQREERR
jgi:RNA polymerase-binding transcription factor